MRFVSSDYSFNTAPSERVQTLKTQVLSSIPHIEADRAILITESYKNTEGLSTIMRRAKALEKLLQGLPIVIREGELIVGSTTKHPRSTQVFPEFSCAWIRDEFDRVSKRQGDVFQFSKETREQLEQVFNYWEGKTTSELACSMMSQESVNAINCNIFSVGNFLYNGIGHVAVDYAKILQKGFLGVINEVSEAIDRFDKFDCTYIKKEQFFQSVIVVCNAAIEYAKRYEALARELAYTCNDEKRKKELLKIAANCKKVPAYGATSFYEACQSFWFVHMIINIESNGHSVSPGRFDQYMYPYYKRDHNISKEDAQELIECLWIKLNDLNKIRDDISSKAFSGYSMFQNLTIGGQTAEETDITNEVSYMCIDATARVGVPQPSLSIRIWNRTPEKFLLKACTLTRLGLGMPAYFNDEVIIPSLINRGLTLEDARSYALVGCVEPHCPGKTDGWHDVGFFNLAKVLEITINNGLCNGKQIGPQTGEVTHCDTFEKLIEAYKKQMHYFVSLMISACNCVELAHIERVPLPYLSSLIDNCISMGKSLQEGGAHYNFSGPLGVGVANVGNSLMGIKKLVFDDKRLTMQELKDALNYNFEGSGKMERIRQMLLGVPKYGNDNDEVDLLVRESTSIFCKEVEKHTNLRGGRYHAGLIPVSANVLLGTHVGATPDGRKAGDPLADGVSPTRGTDTSGPTAAVNSVAKLDHFIATNGILFNQKFHPSALQGENGLKNLASLIRGYFDQKGWHVQFNVIDKDTLLAAQQNPQNYRDLLVRVAGYSAQFISLDKAVQDDIIMRTEQKWMG
jgi:formate C-acetyltransferase